MITLCNLFHVICSMQCDSFCVICSVWCVSCNWFCLCNSFHMIHSVWFILYNLVRIPCCLSGSGQFFTCNSFQCHGICSVWFLPCNLFHAICVEKLTCYFLSHAAFQKLSLRDMGLLKAGRYLDRLKKEYRNAWIAHLVSGGTVGKYKEIRYVSPDHPKPEDGDLWYICGLGFCVCREVTQWLSLDSGPQSWVEACRSDQNVYHRLGFSNPYEVEECITKCHDSFNSGYVWEMGFEFLSLRDVCTLLSSHETYGSQSWGVWAGHQNSFNNHVSVLLPSIFSIDCIFFCVLTSEVGYRGCQDISIFFARWCCVVTESGL